jgi:anti-sigma B factor antagonist
VGVEEHFHVAARREREGVVLELHGELDLAGAPLLSSEIERAELDTSGILVLDLDDLQFIDSTGLRVILAAHESAEERGGEFALTRGSQQVQRLLSIAGVSERLRIIGSPDEVLV